MFAVWEGMSFCTGTGKDGYFQYCWVFPNSLKESASLKVHLDSDHLGQKSVFKAEELLYWPNMKADVKNFILKC